ncbi:MAG: M56 family metallopeptidase, partial [Phycisphaeraceae bacterium]|nr:M56 family metallopeptidase [Phycisphaeraceae bacterium]
LVKLVLPVGLALPSSPTYWARQHLPEIKLFETPLTSSDRAISNPSTVSTDTPAPLQSAVEPRSAATRPISVTTQETPTWQPPVNPSQDVTRQQSAPPLSWQALAMLTWLTTVCVMTGLLVQRAFFVNSLIRQSKPADETLLSQLKRCAAGMNIRRRVDLRLSPNATSPSVCGLLRPVILIPDNLAGDLNPGQTEAVLIHELAHIKRGDLWVNLVQALLQIHYFYNPLLWVANSIIRRIREQAVDEMVLVVMNDHAKDYPDTLLTVSKLVWSKPMLSLRLIGVVESKYALSAGINHILGRPFPKSAKLGVIGIGAILIAAAVLLPMAEAQSDFDLKVHDITISSGHGKTTADKNIKYAGGSELMRAYMAALLTGDADTLDTITSTANETTQQLRLSFNEIDKLNLNHLKSDYRPSSRRTLSSPDPNIYTRIGMFSGGRIKRINGVQYHLLAIVKQVNNTPWQLKDARWYRTDKEMLEAGRIMNAELAQAVVALAAPFKPRGASPLDIADIEHEFNQLNHEIMKSFPERENKTRPGLYGQKVTVAKENVIPVVASFMDSLQQDSVDLKDLRCPGSLIHKLERLRELCNLEGLTVKEIYASHSFAIALTEGIQRHDRLPCQLGFTFIVYPGGRWVFKDTDWLTPQNRLAFVEGFREFYPNVLRVFNLNETPQVRTSVMKAKYGVTLPNGVTVELLGLCEHPSTGKQWWSPDGSLLESAPYQKSSDREAYNDLPLYEIVYRVNPSGSSLAKITRTSQIPGYFGPYPISRQTEDVSVEFENAVYAYIPVQDANGQADLSFACGMKDDWQMLLRVKAPVDQSGMNSDNANIYVSLGQDKRIIAHVTHKLSAEVRVVAKDHDGRLY